MRFPRVLAVDCGASHVAVGRFRRGAAGRWTRERGAVESLPPGTDDAAWPGAVGAALEAVRAREHWGGRCVLGVPGHLTVSKLFRVPAVKARARRQILRFEVSQWLAGTTEELVWSQVAMRGQAEGADIMITAAKRDAIQALVREVQRAGFRPVVAVPAWLPVRAAILRRPGRGGEIGVLNVGARSSLLVVEGGGRFFCRVISRGGDAVTQAIAGELGQSFADAEAWKQRVLGAAAAVTVDGPAEMAVQLAVEEFVRCLGGELARSLVVLGAPASAAAPPVLELSGGGSLIARLPDELARVVPKSVIGGVAAATATPQPGRSLLEASRMADLAALAAGAASREAREADLMPPALRRAIWWRRWWPVLAAAGSLVTAALPGLAWHYRTVALEARHRAGELERRLAAVHRLDARRRANLDSLAEVNQQTKVLQRITEGRSAWAGLLADLQSRLAGVEDVWLERLQPGPPPARAAANPRLRLAGCLLDPEAPMGRAGEGCDRRARAMLARLGECPFVSGIEDERFDAGQPGRLRFELTLVLAPGALR